MKRIIFIFLFLLLSNIAGPLLIAEEEKIEGESFEKMAPFIKSDIRKRKTEAALEDWINSLREKASVRVNKKVLNEIRID